MLIRTLGPLRFSHSDQKQEVVGYSSWICGPETLQDDMMQSCTEHLVFSTMPTNSSIFFSYIWNQPEERCDFSTVLSTTTGIFPKPRAFVDTSFTYENVSWDLA